MQAPSPTLAPDIHDAALAQRIGAHDQAAFALLMRRHNQLLFRTARSILRDDSEAEDVLQEAYLQAYRAIGQFRGDARLSTWLTRIVVNQAIAHARKTSRRAGVLQLHADADAEAINLASEESMNPASESPERGAMRGEACALIEQSIDALPEVYRTVFVLRAVEEMSGDEALRDRVECQEPGPVFGQSNQDAAGDEHDVCGRCRSGGAGGFDRVSQAGQWLAGL